MHLLDTYMSSMEWGSGALAGLAGTGAWWHGTDPAWWMQSMNTWPEVFPWGVGVTAQKWYDEQVQFASTKPGTLKQPKNVDWWCAFRCGLKYPNRRDKQADCLVEECGAAPESVQVLRPQPATNLVILVLAVGLILVGAYALVS